jgi:hypothetical protein
MDTDARFTTPATRRTVVRTGAKLAYAAPLVATSLTLSTLNVAATHSPGHVCPPGRVCGKCPVECEADQWCSFEDPDADWVSTSIIQCFGLDSLRTGCFSCSGCLSRGRPTVLEIVPTGGHCGGNPELMEEKAVCVDPTTRAIVCDAEGGIVCRPPGLPCG